MMSAWITDLLLAMNGMARPRRLDVCERHHMNSLAKALAGLE